MKIFRLLLVATLVLAGAAAPAQALTLAPDSGRDGYVTLAGHLSMLRDPGGRLSVAEAARSDGYEALPDFLSAGYDRDTAFWLRFTLARSPDTPHDWWLEITPPFLDAVTLFEPAADGSFTARTFGDREPFAQREIAHRNFVFPLDLPRTAATTYYVRVQTTSSAAARLLLWQPAVFAGQVGLEYGWYGMYFGITAIIAAFNLIFWLWLRERNHLSYAIYLVTLALTVLTVQGFAGQYLFQRRPELADAMVGISVTLSFAIGVWFFRTVMGVRRCYPRLHHALSGVIVFFALSCVAAIAGYYPAVAAATQLMGLAITLTFIVVGFMLLRRGHRELLLYQIAFSVHYVGVLMNAARNLGVLAPGTIADNAVLIGSAVHMVLLNIALADRIRHAERAKSEAEHRTLKAAHEAEHALEARVTERTDELARANDSLQVEIAERQVLQEQLQAALSAERDAQAMQRQFVATVSHEFRTPLAVIDTTAQTLAFQIAAGDNRDTGRRLDKIRRAVGRLTTLIDNCLTDERLAVGSMALQRQNIDLCELLASVAEEWRTTVTVPLQLELPADGKPILAACDRPLVTLALSNLIDNAVKYSPAGGAIALGIARAGDRAVLAVADRGPGIATDELVRIFDKFYRANTTTGVSGAGLGLYLVRQIARRHGGDVEAAGSPGQGSTFRLILPCTPIS